MSNKKDDLKAAAKEFFIDIYLEFYSDEVIDILRKFLARVTPEHLKQFVADGTALPIPDAAIKRLKGYEDYIEIIKWEEVFQWLAKARPDLAETLLSLEDEGTEYVVKLQKFLLDSIKNPEQAPTKQTGMVALTCESCGEKWELPKDEAEKVTVCPFCGVGREEEPAEEPEE